MEFFFLFFLDFSFRLVSANWSISSWDLDAFALDLFHHPNLISLGDVCVELFTLKLWFLATIGQYHDQSLALTADWCNILNCCLISPLALSAIPFSSFEPGAVLMPLMPRKMFMLSNSRLLNPLPMSYLISIHHGSVPNPVKRLLGFHCFQWVYCYRLLTTC